jgi:hypothetical protein
MSIAKTYATAKKGATKLTDQRLATYRRLLEEGGIELIVRRDDLTILLTVYASGFLSRAEYKGYAYRAASSISSDRSGGASQEPGSADCRPHYTPVRDNWYI